MFKFVTKGIFSNKTSTINSLFKESKKNFAKNEKAIKLRIKSISSIEKITKAMKMVRERITIRLLQVK